LAIEKRLPQLDELLPQALFLGDFLGALAVQMP